MRRSRAFAIAIGSCLLSTTAWGQLSDAQRFELCRQAVLTCQLRDGAVVAVPYREIGRPALVEPYFANVACSGILAAEQMRPNPQNRAFVLRWLKWYAARLKQDGGIFVLDGKRGPRGLVAVQMKAPDSLDSYAGLYLYVAGRYARVAKAKLDAEVVDACTRMLKVLETCRSPNDLFWNFPPTLAPEKVVPAEYLLDNVEVYQGLTEIVKPLRAAGRENEAAQAEGWASELAVKLGQFWSPADSYFVCMFGDRAAKTPWGAQPLYAQGVATVSALALFDNVPANHRAALWTRLQHDYAPQLNIGFNTLDFPAEDPTIERVYLAALRSASGVDRNNHLQLLRTRVDQFLARTRDLGNPAALADGNPFPYCHRFGLMMISLGSPTNQATPYLPTVPLPAPEK